MCEFISWIEYKGEILFLTKKEMETKRGKELKKHLASQYDNDIKGHGAIEWYYNLPPNSGKHRECDDFSSPENFPPVIITSIKRGLFYGIGMNTSLLSLSAWAEYEKITQPARAEYKKIEQSARAEYEKITQPARAEYEKIIRSAWAEYEKITQPARAEYKKIEQSARAEYKKIEQSAFWKLFKKTSNRAEAWR